MSKLFEPYDMNGTVLANRIVMAPMTRSRAVTGIPDEHTAIYYEQRATAGLIISEGVPVSEEGRGYLFTPGIYTDEQTEGWKRVTDAVHAQGGKIFSQLWHVGRLSHVSIQPDKMAPVSSVPHTAEKSLVYAWAEPGTAGPIQASQPRALRIEEIHRITGDFVRAAHRAMEAGFDGVELHGANGYLFEQFINGALNTRDDEYGGSIANRRRFLVDTLDAVTREIGNSHVGVRLSPFGRLYDMRPYAEEAQTWLSIAEELSVKNLAYVHLSDQLTIGAESIPEGFAAKFRQAYQGTLIAAGGFDSATAEAALERGDLDLIAFGRPFISNPDLVERMRQNWPIVEPSRDSFYGAKENISNGYTDYPPYQNDLAS
ncbi:N-ethylmaleimide reductase [Cupriavidus oxalaticus]|uniref:alkene reductase n=1 Tax=Cupriavidus oxalaticus TaxID=96344 RepID=UPI003F73E148